MKGDIDFYYFSGTGNTLLIVKRISNTFKDNGFNVNLMRIECSKGTDLKSDHTIGLGFPVAIFSTYNLVWEFINKLPKVDGTEIFMVDTMGGYSGGLVGPIRSILQKKGYKTIGSCEIVMPINIFYIQDEETNNKKIENGLEKAENYAKDLINGKSQWGRIPFFSDVMNLFSMTGLKLTATNLHQKYFKFKIDPVLCKKCSICTNICPVSNITMEEEVLFGNKCEYCMRCVSMCPEGSIKSMFNYKGKIYRAAKAQDFQKRI